MRPCDRMIRRTLELAEEMLRVADDGDAVREDPSCGVLYGVVRDSAFRIKKLAEEEKEAHIKKGWWKDDSEEGGDAMEEKILEAMKKAGKPVRPGEIAKVLDVESKEVSKVISELKKKGKVISPKRCYYSINE